ncbi:MAG: aminoacyl-tRNA hydrolase [Myxococcaceae bacterium]|nr:aminoacyl-tRNA hydrolase [Myxococcaceae bacterium]
MKIICGLGNPGAEHARQRHNVGFWVVDALAAQWKARSDGEKYDGELFSATAAGEKVLLLKPQTYMNLSGTSLAPLARFFKVPPADVLVVHDELDLPFGKLQLKQGGGPGGHNGLKSILERWGEQDFGRLRFGIGKPPGGAERVTGHVLGHFSPDEQPQLKALVESSVAAAERWVRDGMAKAMNGFNRKG